MAARALLTRVAKLAVEKGQPRGGRAHQGVQQRQRLQAAVEAAFCSVTSRNTMTPPSKSSPSPRIGDAQSSIPRRPRRGRSAGCALGQGHVDPFPHRPVQGRLDGRAFLMEKGEDLRQRPADGFLLVPPGEGARPRR